MSISGIGSNSSLLVQSLLSTRGQLDDLQRQLGSGQKSTTYAGLGADRGLSVSLRNQLNLMTGYADAVKNVGVRINVAQSALTDIANVGTTVKGAANTSVFSIDASGQTVSQRSAVSQLDQVLSLLDTQSGDRYLFSGRATDQPSTDTLDHILNGDGGRAGFKQAMAERNQADLGANGLGRLVIPPASGTQVSISEENPPTVFGMKLASVSTLNGATVTGPTGSPPGITVNLTSNPNPGDAITFACNLPDGTSENFTLSATTDSPPAAGQFTIGATAVATATNLQSALTTAVGKLAATSLTAASAIAAANNFFDVGAGQPSMRVAGSPYTATSLTAGTAANTVTWYTGEMGTDSARGTAVAQIDNSLTVSYGARANEQALTNTIKNIAVYASLTYSAHDPNAQQCFAAVNQRVGSGLASVNGQQQISDIQSELAFAQSTMKSTEQSQQQRSLTLTNLLQAIEQAPPDEVASQILALQTQLQASLQTTAMLSKLSIINFIN
jgi:flagellar hook-associated protein 3 FlgL